MSLTIVRDEEEGRISLLDDGVGILHSKSTTQIKRTKRALEFEARLRPLLERLDELDSELLAAVCAADGGRVQKGSLARTLAVNAVIQEFGDEKREHI